MYYIINIILHLQERELYSCKRNIIFIKNKKNMIYHLVSKENKILLFITVHYYK